MKNLNKIDQTAILSVERNKNTYNTLFLIKNFTKPLKPEKENNNEKLAQINFQAYKPSILDFLLGSAQIKKNWLRYLIKIAIKEDQKEYDLKYKDYLIDLEIWKNSQDTIVKNNSQKKNDGFLSSRNLPLLLSSSN